LPLPYGLSVTARPLSTSGTAAAQAAARRAVESIERQARERMDAGLPLDGLPDLSAEGDRDGFYQAQLIRELAVRHITSWTGVGREGRPAPSTTKRPQGGVQASGRRLEPALRNRLVSAHINLQDLERVVCARLKEFRRNRHFRYVSRQIGREHDER
jgi:hypothetical protein